MLHRLAFATSLVLVFASASSALAQEGPATRFLKAQHERVNRVLARPAQNDAQRNTQRDEVTEILRALLDLDAMARESLGQSWGERSEAERTEFVTLLRSLVERSYRENLTTTQHYRVSYGEETPSTTGGSERVVLHTTVRDTENRRAPEITIDYRMRRDGERWVVDDVVTDGVSMVGNYRSQFARIIRRDGFPALLDRMRSRLREGSSI
jgi:phospholipid transport system substrate-binding protein